MNDHFNVAVIGTGPAGMMAAISAKNNSNRVCLFEKNSSAGKKLLLTGKGRCNVTTNKDVDEIIATFGKNGKFLYGALSRFSNRDIIDFFEKREVKLKVERGDRVFPVSDRAQSILNCLLDELRKKKVEVFFSSQVKKITKKDAVFQISFENKIISADKLIIATGGKSYPETGSTGDGYRFAQHFKHTIIKPTPSLVPLTTDNKKIHTLAGLSLKNVQLGFYTNGKVFAEDFGEMLFTHQGISGPIVLEMSASVHEQLVIGNAVIANIDLKPKLDEITLKKRIHREIEAAPKKEYQSLLKTLLPRLLIAYAITETKIDQHHQNSLLTTDQIACLIEFLKSFEFEINGTESIKKAIVTHGGVPVNEISSKTMESKIIPGLYFAGEIICLDGPSGGYNLTKAFSTGYSAGLFASESNL